MLLRVIVILFSICWSSAFAERNFWNNDICTKDADCKGLTSCDLTFGCTISGAKVGILMLTVFVILCAIIVAVACLCRRNLGSNRFARPHNQYLPQTVITTNPPQWNQHQVGTTVYPNNPYPNQFYANSVNPPSYNQYPGQYQIDPRMGAAINVHQVIPTAPYPPAGYNYGS